MRLHGYPLPVRQRVQCVHLNCNAFTHRPDSTDLPLALTTVSVTLGTVSWCQLLCSCAGPLVRWPITNSHHGATCYWSTYELIDRHARCHAKVCLHRI